MPMKGRSGYPLSSFFVAIFLGLALSHGNAAEPASESDTERLAKETQNPVANLISVPSLNKDWNLITRTISRSSTSLHPLPASRARSGLATSTPVCSSLRRIPAN
jgi:hypothetical protein